MIPVGIGGRFRCPANSTGKLFPDTKDCSYFYNCAGKVAIHMPCTQGLYFNPIKGYCDYPANVKCITGQLLTTPHSIRPTVPGN